MGPAAARRRAGSRTLDLVVLADPAARPGRRRRRRARAVRPRAGRRAAGHRRPGRPGLRPGALRSAAAPAAYDPTEQKEEATLALALVIDRSGSMSGPKMDLTKEAARGAAELLNAQDLIAVVTFDSQAQTVVRLQPASNRQRILGDIAADPQPAAAPTSCPACARRFDQLLTARARKQTRHRAVGRTVAGRGRARAGRRGRRRRHHRVGGGRGRRRRSGPAADHRPRGGGRFHHARDPVERPAHLHPRDRRVAARSNLVEAPSRVRLVRPTQALAGIPFASAPAAGRATRAPRVRPGAEVLLASAERRPAAGPLATGAGAGAGLDQRPRRRAGRRPGCAGAHCPKLWGQLARSAMSRRGARELPLSSCALQADRCRRAGPGLRCRRTGRSPGLHGQLPWPTSPQAARCRARPTGSLRCAERCRGPYEAEVPLGPGGGAAAAEAELRGRCPRRGPAAPSWRRGSCRCRWRPTHAASACRRGAEQAGRCARRPRRCWRAVSGADRTGSGDLAALRAPAAAAPSPDRITAGGPCRWRCAARWRFFLRTIAARRANFRAPGRRRRVQAADQTENSIFGAWRSLVARSVRDRKVAGSNPVAPTTFSDESARRARASALLAPRSPASRISAMAAR